MEQDLIMENIMSSLWSNQFLWSSTRMQKGGHFFGTAWSRWHVLWLGIAAVAERSLTSYQHDDFVDSLNHARADFSLSQRESEAVCCLLVNPHKPEVNLKTCFPRTLDQHAVVTKCPCYFGSYVFSPLDGGKSQTWFPLLAWWRISDLFSTLFEAILAYIAYIFPLTFQYISFVWIHFCCFSIFVHYAAVSTKFWGKWILPALHFIYWCFIVLFAMQITFLFLFFSRTHVFPRSPSW